jgi:cytochrome c peroxidase
MPKTKIAILATPKSHFGLFRQTRHCAPGLAGLARTRILSFRRRDRLSWLAGLAVFTISVALLAGCRSASTQDESSDISPQHLYMFSALRAPAPPSGVNALRVNLGRRLYYDEHLSKNESISCNDCHQLTKYGVDPRHAVSNGWDGTPGGRNSPTVYNAGLQFVQFWDGRAPTLAAQASGPMMNPVEMGMPEAATVLAYIHANPNYVKEFKAAYSGMKDPIVMENVTDAIAAFEEGLLTPSRWDKYLQGEVNALSDEEQKGLRVFLDSGCASCHAGEAMGGNSYAQLGAYRNWPDQKSDTGRFAVTHQDRDRMYFKVPMLRNVAETGPWFHNGKVQTLDEAVRLMSQYETGKKLSDREVASIVSFLHVLTGEIPQQYIQKPSDEPNPSQAAHQAGRAAQFNPQQGE